MTTSNLIKGARERHGWSQSKLAKISGVPQPAISKLESGVTQVGTPLYLARLSEALKVDLRALAIGGEINETARPVFHDEESALQIYRNLDEKQRILWKAIGRTILEIGEKEK